MNSMLRTGNLVQQQLGGLTAPFTRNLFTSVVHSILVSRGPAPTGIE